MRGAHPQTSLPHTRARKLEFVLPFPGSLYSLQESQDDHSAKVLEVFWKDNGAVQFSADKIQIKRYVLQKDNAEVSCVGHLREAYSQDYSVLPAQKPSWWLPTAVTQTTSNPSHRKSGLLC